MKLEEFKEALKIIRSELSSEERRTLARYLWSFMESDDDSEVDRITNPLDLSYYKLKRDEEKLRRQKTVVDAIVKVIKITMNLCKI